MLIALLTLLFLGGGSANAMLDYIADTKPRIKEVVIEDERRAEALGTLKEMRAEQKRFSKLVNGTVKSLKRELAEDPGATGDAFWQDYFAAKQASDQRMIDLRFQLRDQLTREEWEQIFPAPEK